MDCIYYPSFNINNNYINIERSHTNHLKALRIQLGNELILTNGEGLLVKTIFMDGDKESFIFKVTEIIEQFEEFPHRFALALAMLGTRDRFEFAFEKAVELGVTDFFPLITKHTQKEKIRKERLTAKAISAIAQSQRAMLPIIHNPINIIDLAEQFPSFDKVCIADIDAAPIPDNTGNNQYNSVIAIIGPEGGFSAEELDLLRKKENSLFFSLGKKRLRSETAAIVSLGLLSKAFN